MSAVTIADLEADLRACGVDRLSLARGENGWTALALRDDSVVVACVTGAPSLAAAIGKLLLEVLER